MKWIMLSGLVALVVVTAVMRGRFPANSGVTGKYRSLPLAGEWTLTLNPTALATCLNTRSFQLPTARIFQPTAYTDSLTISGNGFRFRGDEFARIPGTSRFSGTITLADGVRAPIQFNLVTPSHMTGQVVAYYRVDTTRCSQSVPLIFNRTG